MPKFNKSKGFQLKGGNNPFKRNFPSVFKQSDKVVTVGDDKWEDWQEGKTVKGGDGGSTRTDTRKGTRDTTTYTPPTEFMPQEEWDALGKEEQDRRDAIYKEANTVVTTEDLSDERVETTPPEQPESKYSMRISKDPGFGRHGGPSRTSSTGLVSDPSGIMGIEVDGVNYRFPDARGGTGKHSMDDLKNKNPEAYEEAMNMAATAGYGGGGSESDLKTEGGGWDMTDYTSTSARNPGEKPGWTPEGGRTTREMRANPTQSVAGPRGYVEGRDEAIEPQIDPNVFKMKGSHHYGYKKKV